MTKMKPFDKDTAFDLRQYIDGLIRHKWVIILTMILALTFAFRYNSRLVPIYRATATLIIDKESSRSPLTGQPTNYETYLSESLSFNTHFELITSRPVLEQVIKDLGLGEVDEQEARAEFVKIHPLKEIVTRLKTNLFMLLGRKDAPQPAASETERDLVPALKGMVVIENIEDTRLLKINASSPNPHRARDIANALGQAYITFNINNRMKASQDTLSWLTERLYEMKKMLEDAETEFLDYKQQVRLISVEDRQKMIGQKITEFNDAYIQTRNKRLELETKLDQLNRMWKSNKSLPVLRSLIDNELINDLHAQLVEAELERSRLSKVYKHKHPKTIQINSRIEQSTKRLEQEVKKEIDNLKATKAVLLARERALQKTIADFEKEGIETNKNELQHAMLKRNVEMNQKLYDALLVRLKEADVTGNIDVSNIRITEIAQLPSAPVGPNKKRNLILAAILGLMIGIGISFLLETMEQTLRTEEDVQKYLGLPVLSVIPLADKGKHGVYGNGPDPEKKKKHVSK